MNTKNVLRGQIWPQDQWGRVLNAALKFDELPTPTWALVDRIVDLAVIRFGESLHGIYLSGPAARGRPGGTSLILLLKGTQHASEGRAWRILTEQQIEQANPEQGPINIEIHDWNHVFVDPVHTCNTRFQLGVNSVCISGPDISRLIPPQKLDDSIGNLEILLFGPRITRAAAQIAGTEKHDRRDWHTAAQMAGRSALSAGFAMVMVEEQVYTEDPDMRRDLFALREPDRRRDIEMAYRIATASIGTRTEAMQEIERVCRWLTPMTEAWLNTHNPRRLQSLRV